MADPYAQAAMIAAPFARLGSQMFQGEALREQGRMKAEQAAAQQAMIGSHANLYNAQAQKAGAEAQALQQRSQYQKPEFASTVAAALAGLSEPQGRELAGYQQRGNWGVNPGAALPADQEGPPMPDMPKSAPSWYKPEVEQRFNQGRGVVLGNLAGSGNSKIDDMTKAFVELLGRNDYDASKASPAAVLSYAQSQYAQKGGAPFHQGTNGVMNVLTGAERLNDVGTSAALENRAQANNANASAGQHSASAALARSKIGQPTVNPDGSVTRPMIPAKPMPAAALKMQQEELDNLATASGINPMLQRFADDIDAKKLKLGPVANMVSKGKNFAGASDENSKNFASFQATIEKLRNDSLRLNKGVQTDGDAQRAWNELMSNINDPGVVKQRIAEIQQINDRAVQIKQMNVNQIRKNYGQPDIDASGYKAEQAPQKPPALASVPPAAIEFLKANPGQANAFAAKYGREAADAALGRGR